MHHNPRCLRHEASERQAASTQQLTAHSAATSLPYRNEPACGLLRPSWPDGRGLVITERVSEAGKFTIRGSLGSERIPKCAACHSGTGRASRGWAGRLLMTTGSNLELLAHGRVNGCRCLAGSRAGTRRAGDEIHERARLLRGRRAGTWRARCALLGGQVGL